MQGTVILIPTYNERENIGYMVPRIFTAYPQARIVVIDDNSPDRTDDAVREMMKRYPGLSLLSRMKKAGLGAAYKHGITHALSLPSVERIVMMDADGSHDVKHLSEMFVASERYELVIGSRYVKGGSVGQWVLWRRILSHCGNFYARTLAGLPVSDMTAGFLCFGTSLLKRMDLDHVSASGYAFLMELKFHAIHDAHATVHEIPIQLQSRREGESKLSSHIIREGLRTPLQLFIRRFQSVPSSRNATISQMPNCHICGSSVIRFYCEKRGYKLYECTACGLVFVYPMPEDLTKIYGEDYFRNVSKKDSHGYTDYDKDKEPMRSVFERALAKMESLTRGRRIFDVGAATGYFLDVARERSWQTQGSEISEYGASEAARRGHKMIYGDLTTMKDLPIVDVVTMWDVLEHVSDPRSLSQAVNRMLPQGGIFVLNTPDVGSVWARLLKGKWQLIVPPEHVHYYAAKNMRLLLEQSGFEVSEISRMGKTFSLPYIFKMLWSWQRLSVWDWLARASDNKLLRHIKIPINLRDNMFVIARKVHDV